ncbi:MAG TPA: tRNA epoxyqueuosine(34) reductase QueG [Spongiibacteraceae bacterium]|nr:tRNA epoxyqueuosine(34) reductase QueG [Spongiibacteraceae bacterium]
MSNYQLDTHSRLDFAAVAEAIRAWGKALGFQQVAFTDTDLESHAAHLKNWLHNNYHGEMAYMAAHGAMRWTPQELVPGTLRVISVRMDYLPPQDQPESILADGSKAYISRYALGRDYHKLMRKRLAQLAQRINDEITPHNFRALVDSAPVLERGLAQKAGLGWIGKNSMLINSKAGSWFFLGEIYTDLPLPIDRPQVTEHCGSCRACIDICPTGAIVAPNQVDARRCISYLTIELSGSIPEEFRTAIGNRIYGCDDCQLVCPWNKFAATTGEADFQPRHGLADVELITLFNWSEQQFLDNTAGSPIRRIGYLSWLRNIAVALGNAPYAENIVAALQARSAHPSELVREHVTWALEQQNQKTRALPPLRQ